ncbi:MAG TPA: STAS domain-containing protein [Gemmatimonadales bacterium]|nr:STAS domain-containing protein [Gemmatimonadales bacterium]
MRIDTVRDGESTVLRLGGRLDREWAEHLAGTFQDLLRHGVRSLVVDLSGVTYVSSAAMEVLARGQQELAGLRGEVRLAAIPAEIRRTFAIGGWGAGAEATGSAGPSGADLRQSSWHLPALAAKSGDYQTSVADAEGGFRCRTHGHPERLLRGPLGEGDGDVVALGPGGFALGLGGIGERWEDTREHLGELVGAAGCAACFPADGARLPDYLVGDGAVPPRVRIAVGLSCQGSFSRLVRFSPRGDAESVPISELLGVCLDAAGGSAAGIVIAGETAGLTGARIRRSPGVGDSPLRYDVPAIRDWLSFSPERTHPRATTLIAGVVARSPQGPLAAHLRPLATVGRLAGHLHAAVFSYRALPQRTVELEAFVKGVFRTHQLHDVLHLLWDDRGQAGAGESALVRGVGWVAPITQIA